MLELGSENSQVGHPKREKWERGSAAFLRRARDFALCFKVFCMKMSTDVNVYKCIIKSIDL